MKRLAFPFLLASLLIVGIFSCEKDEFTEEDALDNQINLLEIKDSISKDSLAYVDSVAWVRDSLEKIGGKIQYTLKVISGGDAGILKSTNGLDGVSVAISQHGIIDTAETVNGMVIFDDMRIGTFNVTVEAENYTGLDFIAEINVPQSNNADFENIDRTAANMVTIFPLTGPTMATISGQITMETDLTNMIPEAAVGVLVTGSINVEDNDFKDRFVDNYNHTDEDADYFAIITHMAYSNIVMRATTDENGMYSLQVPSTADEDGLDIELQISEIAVDQTLYMYNRYDQDLTVDQVRQTVRTLFGAEMNTTDIPIVHPVYVIISAPTGADFMQPAVDATAVAHIGESSIQAINISNQGKDYTQAPQVIITSAGSGEGAEATATMVDGKVTGIIITEGGIGYEAGNTTVSLATVVDEIATVTTRVEYEITEVTVTPGAGYTSAPDVEILSPQGSGATATAIMNGYVDDIQVTNGGSGYSQAPNIVIAGGNGYGATATANMSSFNRIQEISTLDYTVDTFTVVPEVLITTTGTGSGAKATANLASTGVLLRVDISDGGAGYTEAPTVTISGGGGYGAQAHSVIGGGIVTGVVIDDGGEGYTSNPTVTIGIAPTGGSNAAGTAVRGRRISSFTLTDRGNGYDAAANIDVSVRAIDTDPWTSTFNLAFDGTTPDVYLDMSVRSVTVVVDGDDFTAAPTVTFVPIGMVGTAAAATASISYEVAAIEVTAAGSGYRSAEDAILVTIGAPSAGGTQAVGTAVEGNGVLVSLTITDPGLGYTAVPLVKFAGGGADAVHAEITPVITDGSVTSFVIDDAGEGYASDPTITIYTYETAAVATVMVNVTAGQIEWIEITNPGEGYTVVPSVEIIAVDNGGDQVIDYGTGASATAELDEYGRVLAITVDDPGTAYYRAPQIKLTIPEYNTPAIAYADVNDFGVVTYIDLTIAGMGYVEAPTVTLTGVDGIGAGATAIALVKAGKLDEIILTDGGTGYLARNYPGYFGGTSIGYVNGDDDDGWDIDYFQGEVDYDNINVVNGQSYIQDIYLGTGDRVEEY